MGGFITASRWGIKQDYKPVARPHMIGAARIHAWQHHTCVPFRELVEVPRGLAAVHFHASSANGRINRNQNIIEYVWHINYQLHEQKKRYIAFNRGFHKIDKDQE